MAVVLKVIVQSQGVDITRGARDRSPCLGISLRQARREHQPVRSAAAGAGDILRDVSEIGHHVIAVIREPLIERDIVAAAQRKHAGSRDVGNIRRVFVQDVIRRVGKTARP